jgi:8-oxo-dGTP pyrophosphatase MutT (NUDIX family)
MRELREETGLTVERVLGGSVVLGLFRIVGPNESIEYDAPKRLGVMLAEELRAQKPL